MLAASSSTMMMLPEANCQRRQFLQLAVGPDGAGQRRARRTPHHGAATGRTTGPSHFSMLRTFFLILAARRLPAVRPVGIPESSGAQLVGHSGLPSCEPPDDDLALWAGELAASRRQEPVAVRTEAGADHP